MLEAAWNEIAAIYLRGHRSYKSFVPRERGWLLPITKVLAGPNALLGCNMQNMVSITAIMKFYDGEMFVIISIPGGECII